MPNVTMNGEMELKVTVRVPADLAPRRGREWFRAEFEAVCIAHLDDIREMLAPGRRYRTRKRKEQSDGA